MDMDITYKVPTNNNSRRSKSTEEGKEYIKLIQQITSAMLDSSKKKKGKNRICTLVHEKRKRMR